MADPNKIGYFFAYELKTEPKRKDHLKGVMDEVEAWIDAHKRRDPPVYYYVVGAGFLLIHDMRHGDGRFVSLAGLQRDVVLMCDQAQSRHALANQLRPLYAAEVEDGKLNAVIDELVMAEILIAEGEQVLTLPIGHRPRSTAELQQLVFGAAEYAPSVFVQQATGMRPASPA